MAEAILDRADGSAASRSTGSIFVHDPDDSLWKAPGDSDLDSSITSTWSNSNSVNDEVVLIYDWTQESNDAENGWLEAAADNLFASLLIVNEHLPGELDNTRFIDLARDGNTLDLHFIGHSRGAVLNTLVTQRFANYFSLLIDHVTSLDPHPARLVGNDPFLDDDVPTLNNVSFADNYYRVDPNGFYEELTGDFSGVTVDGAFNLQLNESFGETSIIDIDDPTLDLIGVGDGDGYAAEHSDTHLWYHGTINLSTTASDGAHLVPDEWYGGAFEDRNAAGFSFSRIAGRSQQPDPNDGNKSEAAPIASTVFNGDFSFGDRSFNEIPGWERHGGGGSGELDGSERYLELSQNGQDWFRRHNPLYLPPNITGITFDYNITNNDPGPNDELRVLHGANQIGDPIPLGSETDGWIRDFTIPFEVAPQGLVDTLEFQIADIGGDGIDSAVLIDNIEFELAPSIRHDQYDGIDLEADIAGIDFLVWNDGGGTLDYAVTIDQGTDLFFVAPSSGSSNGWNDRKTHTVIVDRSALSAGQVATGRVKIESPGVHDSPQFINLVVSGLNDDPVVTSLDPVPLLDKEGATFIVNAAFSDDDDLDTHSATINWGDETIEPGMVNQAAKTVFGDHEYGDEGDYIIIVTVKDNHDGMGDDGMRVVVVNALPIIQIMGAPTSSPAEGTQITLGSDVNDPGKDDTHEYKWTVTKNGSPFDDGTGNPIDQPTFTFTPDDNGVFGVKLEVWDDDMIARGEEPVTESTSIDVTNEPPSVLIVDAPASSPEGTQINLSSEIDDPGKNDTHEYVWSVTKNGVPYNDGTGNPTSQSSFSFTPDDGPATFAVTLDVRDNDMVASSEAPVKAMESINVTDVEPTIELTGDSMVDEGSIYTLTLGDITDPGNDTVTNWIVNWGDGKSDTYTSDGEKIHIYADDMPGGTSSDEYTIRVDLRDEDTTHLEAGRKQVTVANINPSLWIRGMRTVHEGTPFTVENIGLFTDPGFGPTETFTGLIDWGDGTSTDEDGEIDILGSEGRLTYGTFDGLYTYADEGTDGTGTGRYYAHVRVKDDDEGYSGRQVGYQDRHEGFSNWHEMTIIVKNVAPHSIVLDPFVPSEGQPAQLSGRFTDPGIEDTHTVTVSWGDGEDDTVVVLAAGENPKSFLIPHTYADDGPTPGGTIPPSPVFSYPIRVTIDDGDGGQGRIDSTAEVHNVAPTVNAGVDQSATEGEVVSFAGSFTDPGQLVDTHTFCWNFGDGAADVCDTLTPTHVYADNREYTVTLTVTDDDTGVGSDTLVVSVGNAIPAIDQQPSNQAAFEGQSVILAPLNFSDLGTLDTHTATINWGDGTVDSGTITETPFGPPGNQTGMSGTVSGSHVFADDGTYTVTVTVSDDEGAMSAAKSFQVTVDNVRPSLSVTGTQTVNEGTELSLSSLALFTDPGFDNPLDSPPTTESFSYRINWGDGHIDTGAVTDVTQGGPVVPTQGTIGGSHIYADNGSFTVAVTVFDDDRGEDTKELTINVNNLEPDLSLTLPTVLTLNEGSELVLPVLGSFTDPAFFDPTLGNVKSFTYEINWGDGIVESKPVTNVQQGGLGTPTQGTFDANHTYADNGTYTVTVSVIDDDGGRDPKMFDVVVENVSPSLFLAGNQSTRIGEPLDITDVGLLIDPGFDNLLNVGGETQETFTYSINWGDGSAADSGAVTIDVAGGPGVMTTGSFDASHTYDAVPPGGIYTVTVMVSDDDDDDDSQPVAERFEVTVTEALNPESEGEDAAIRTFNSSMVYGPLPPSEYAIATASVNGGLALSTNRPASLIYGPMPPDSLSFVEVSPPNSASVSAENTEAVCRFEPDLVNDQSRRSADTENTSGAVYGPLLVPPSLALNGLRPEGENGNEGPILTVIGNQVANEGTRLTITDIATFIDLDSSGPFQFQIDWKDDRPVDVGPATIDVIGPPTAGSFDGNHTYNDNGVFVVDVTVTVIDNETRSTTESFEISVSNVVPMASLGNDGPVPEGSTATVSFSNQSDSNGDLAAGLRYSYDLDNDGRFDVGDGTYNGSVNTASHVIPANFTDDGSVTQIVAARILDKDGGFSDYTTPISVSNVKPTATFSNDGAVDEGSTAIVSLSAQFDPSSADTATGFRYAYDLDNDGTFDVGDGTYDGSVRDATQVVPASFLDDGLSVQPVRAVIIDKDEGSSEYTTPITVNNVNPTATFSNDGPVDEGSTAIVSFSEQFEPSSADTAAGFRYAYDIDNDGTFDIGDGTYGGSVTESTQIVPASLLDDGSASHTVRARIIDKDQGSNEYTTPITVNNVAPTASFSNDGPVDEGSTAIVSFGNQFDPSDADTAAGFRYAYDLDNDGTFDIGDGTYGGSVTDPTQTVPASSLDDGLASHTVRARIIDKDDGFTDGMTTITVNNVAPTVELFIDEPVDEGSTASIRVDVFDPSEADTAAGFHVVCDFDDGSRFDSVGPPPTVPIPPELIDDGPLTVSVSCSASDKDHATGSSGPVPIGVRSVSPTAAFSNDGPVKEGSTAIVSFSNQFDPSDADTAAGFRYAYDLDNDGTFEIGDGTYRGSVSDPTQVVPASFLDDGLSVHTVRAVIIDKDEGSNEYTTPITVNNVAPTASFSNDGPVDEGSTAIVSFGNQFDPSDADTAAGFRYAYDLDNDGTFDVGDGTYDGSVGDAMQVVPASFLDDGLSVQTIRAVIIDKDEGSNEYTTPITLNNVAPTATFSNDGPVIEGSTATVSFSEQFDPSSADTATGFRYAYDLDNDGTFDVGDGTYDGSVRDATQVVPASFLDDGLSVQPVRAVIIDKDEGSSEYMTNIDVLNGAPIAVDDTYNFDGIATTEIDAANGLLANDRDPGNDSLKVVLPIGPIDPPHLPTNTIDVKMDGGFTYTPPDGGFSGTVSFRYTATDGTLNSEEAEVTIDVGRNSAISGFVFADFDADERFDSGGEDGLIEDGLPLVTVTLRDSQCNVVENKSCVELEIETSRDGSYRFEDLFSGTYTISITPPCGITVDGRSKQLTVTVGPGEEVADANIGLGWLQPQYVSPQLFLASNSPGTEARRDLLWRIMDHCRAADAVFAAEDMWLDRS